MLAKCRLSAGACPILYSRVLMTPKDPVCVKPGEVHYVFHRWMPTKRFVPKPLTGNMYEDNIGLHNNPSIEHILLQTLQPENLASNLNTVISLRAIDLDPLAVGEQRRHRWSQFEQRMATCRLDNDGHVSAKRHDLPIHLNFIGQTLRPAVVKLGVHRTRLHDMRPPHASILPQQDVTPRVRQRPSRPQPYCLPQARHATTPCPGKPSHIHLDCRSLV